MRTNKKKTVVVGMSGGVDSSVAAHLLKEQGYDVIGVTMQIWQPEDACTIQNEGGCCGLSAVEDARRVANQLEIPYYVLNFREVFEKNVIHYFTREYLLGRTPNPCIACNRFVKWEALLHRSLEIGADYIATGHYARILRLANGRYAIGTSATAQKDQSYALYNLTQEQLSRTRMPVGAYTKPQVRQLAEELGLQVAHKPDSQEICFIPDQDYAGFIRKETGESEQTGWFVTKDGHRLGRHKGISHYTVGQRKGLDLALGYPVFVTQIRPESREVVIGRSEDVFSVDVAAHNWSWMGADSLQIGERVLAKIRYSDRGAYCHLTAIQQDYDEAIYHFQFENPVRAITPGQALVLYRDEFVLGGGTIC